MTATAPAGQDVAVDPEIGRSADVGGIATNYHDLGRPDRADQPALLMLHGSGPGVSAWANWRGVLPELARTRRVVAPDVLGFGHTRAPAGQRWDLNAWYEHLAGLLDVLDLGRVSVIGNSFGGALALRLATEQPERVDRLVLMGSVGVPFALTPGLDAVWGFTPTLESMQRVLELFAHDPGAIGPDLAQLRLRAATRPGVAEAFAAMFPEPRQERVDALVIDQRAVARLQQPTLIVHGRDDQVIPLQTSLRLLELVPAAQLHVFGQCGHWVQIEQRSRFLALVSAFLAE